MRSGSRWLAGVGLPVLLAVAAPVGAGWWEVNQADAELDLAAASGLAVAAVADGPQSADAVAAAAWWLENLAYLELPERILAAARPPIDPQLGFLLARIEGTLARRPPDGALAAVELAGPFGAFPTLDLERQVVPADRDLPAVGTPWRGVGSAFRLQLRTATGIVAPPDDLAGSGVYLAAWTIVVDEDQDGWMVAEAIGGFDLEVDGRLVARLRRCGRVDPGISWYRVHLESGRHRVRMVIGSSGRPQARLSLFDDVGRPLAVRTEATGAEPWSGSRVEPTTPPAVSELEQRLADGAGTDELMLAATVAGSRGDPVSQRRLLERALAADPDNPWLRLESAWYRVTASTGADPEGDLRLARDHLRRCRRLPRALLVEHAVAGRERRTEDAERLLRELVEEHHKDPRVVQLWVREAVRRGWLREAEEGMAQLALELPESPVVAELRLVALAALDRLEERQALLRTLLQRDVLPPAVLEELTSACLVDEAVAAIERLRERFDDPEADMALVRLLMGRGDRDRARRELEAARARWGDLAVIDELQLAVDAADPDLLEAALDGALSRDPGSLELRSLAWRRGAEPFFERYRVDVDDVMRGDRGVAGDSDLVLLLDQAVERIFPDGTSLYYYHGVSRAITPVGARQASTLQPLSDALWLRVRILKPDGRVEVPADLTVRDGVVQLEGVKPGDVVEEEYVARVGSSDAFAGGHLSPYIYRFADPERAFGLSEYLLLVPPAVELRVAGNFTGLEHEQWQEGDLQVVRWRAERMPPVVREPFAPPNQDLLPWVSYGFGISWQQVGDAFRDRALEVLEGTDELTQWGTPLTADADPIEVVRNLVAAVCDEVEAGRTALSLAATAGESFSRRLGNRLGIIAAVLDDAGWEVDLVLARPSPLAGTNLEVPTLDAFPEPLLRVQAGDREVWIDIEEQRRGVDHIRPILQAGDALVLPLTRPTEPVRIIERLPTFDNPELEQQMRVSAAVDATGDARIDVEVEMRGGEAEEILQLVEGVPADRTNLVLQRIALNLFPGAAGVRGTVSPTSDGALVRLELELAKACEDDRGDLICRSLVVTRPLVPMLAPLPQRTYPLVLQLPLLRRVELAVTPPAGWTIDRPARRLATQWGAVDEVLTTDGGRTRSVLTIAVPAQTVSPEQYLQFARFCHAVDELTSRPPRLRAVRD